MASRTIEIEKNSVRSLRTCLSLREASPYDHLFLNRDGKLFNECGVRDLVEEYRVQAGITEKVTPRSLRHTFASAKARSCRRASYHSRMSGGESPSAWAPIQPSLSFPNQILPSTAACIPLRPPFG